VALGQVFAGSLGFPLSVSFHRCSIFTPVSSWEWTKVPLEAQIHRDRLSLHRNTNSLVYMRCLSAIGKLGSSLRDEGNFSVFVVVCFPPRLWLYYTAVFCCICCSRMVFILEIRGSKPFFPLICRQPNVQLIEGVPTAA
jgi:hypothetical protein